MPLDDPNQHDLQPVSRSPTSAEDLGAVDGAPGRLACTQFLVRTLGGKTLILQIKGTTIAQRADIPGDRFGLVMGGKQTPDGGTTSPGR